MLTTITPLLYQPYGVVRIAAPFDQSAAVDPKHHGQAGTTRRGCKDIQEQAILAAARRAACRDCRIQLRSKCLPEKFRKPAAASSANFPLAAPRRGCREIHSCHSPSCPPLLHLCVVTRGGVANAVAPVARMATQRAATPTICKSHSHFSSSRLFSSLIPPWANQAGFA